MQTQRQPDGPCGVVTTIQPPTRSLTTLSEKLAQHDALLIVIGDQKGPASCDLPGAEFYSLPEQQALGFSLSSALPLGHYARKNVGYLVAIGRGAGCIYETDDDNAPNDAWQLRGLEVEARSVGGRQWCNVYRFFSPGLIWPRGFPLELIHDAQQPAGDVAVAAQRVVSPIQQGLVNVSPDVDAVWRMVVSGEFQFESGPSVHLEPGTWCPFNSQSTWWWPPAYPLLYLPSYCSFRMTDIWRSFIAQRCLWESGRGVVFHEPEADQERNPHNLMRDFNDEVPGYLGNADLVRRLEDLSLEPGAESAAANLRRCYAELVAAEYFPASELELVDAWIADLTKIQAKPSAYRLAG